MAAVRSNTLPRWRGLPALALTIAVFAIAAALVGAWLMTVNGTGTPAAIVILAMIVDVAVAVIVVRHQPRNAVGWILLGIAVFAGAGWFLWDYGYRAVVFGPSWLPLGVLALWAGLWIWLPAVALLLPALLLRFPDGRRSARWWWVEPCGIVASAALMLSIALAPGPLDARVATVNPFGVEEEWVILGLRWIGYVLLAAATVGAVTAMWSRRLTSHGDEREQLKWITSAAVLCAVALVYGLVRQLSGEKYLFDALTPFFVSTVAIPISIGVAIQKYRLYDIDLVINRALVYGGLTAMLAGLYTFLVALTQRLVAVTGQKSDIAILLTAFIGATAFTPVKGWLQKTVDRRYAVHDPASVVDSMREQIEVIVNVLDAQRIARRLVEDSASTYQARYVALTLGNDGDAAPFHACGDAAAGVALAIQLHSDGKSVGVLSLSGRRGGAPYSPRDQKALQLCADAVGEALDLWEDLLGQPRGRPART